MGRYEVRNCDFKRFKADHNSGNYKDKPLGGDRQPVVHVSWDDAKAFCAWLTQTEQAERVISKDQSYRLPTEKEWELAAGKAGYPFGKKWPPSGKAGNYADETAKRDLGETSIIDGYDDGCAVAAEQGAFDRNKSGFYDMGGNVAEWCKDWFDQKQKSHVIRGGSWKTAKAEEAETSARRVQDGESEDVGFRIVLSGPGFRR
jgi:formylglycine-generating enzyme required for sulfatase activity